MVKMPLTDSSIRSRQTLKQKDFASSHLNMYSNRNPIQSAFSDAYRARGKLSAARDGLTSALRLLDRLHLRSTGARNEMIVTDALHPHATSPTFGSENREDQSPWRRRPVGTGDPQWNCRVQYCNCSKTRRPAIGF